MKNIGKAPKLPGESASSPRGHICMLAGSEAERERFISSYLAKIVRDHDAQVFVLGDQTSFRFTQLLTETVMSSVSPGRSIQVSSLTVAPRDKKQRWVDSSNLRLTLEEQISGAIRNDRDVYMVNDVTALLSQRVTSTSFSQLEAWIESLMAKWPITVICLNDLQNLTGELLVQLLRTHDRAVLGDRLILNTAPATADDRGRRHQGAPGRLGSPSGSLVDLTDRATGSEGANLPAINALGNILGGISNETEIAKLAVSAARVLFGADLAGVVLGNSFSNNDTFFFCRGKERQPSVHSLGPRGSKGTGPFGSDFPEETIVAQSLLTVGVDAGEIGSLATVPLLANGQPVGMVFVGLQTPDQMGEFKMALFDAFAVQLALALQCAQLRGQHAVGQKRAAALYEVTHALTTTLELHQVLHLVVEKARSLLNVERCTLFLLNETKDCLHGMIGSAAPDELIRKMRLPLDQDLASRQAVETKKPVLIVDAPNDPRPLHDAVVRYGVTNILYVPLVAHDEVIGTIDVDDTRHPHDFTEEEQDLVLAFANQAAVAIENAMLYDRERQAVAKLQELNTLINDEHAKLQRSVSIHDQLTRLVLEGQGTEAIAETLASLVGNPVVVEDQFHHLVAHSKVPVRVDRHRQETITLGGTPKQILDHEEVARLLKRALAEKRPTQIPPLPQLGMDYSRVIAPIVAGDSVLGYAFVLESESQLMELDIVALEHAASVLALELMKQRIAFDVEMRLKGAFLDDLIEGNFEQERSILDRGAHLGYDLSMPHQLFIVDVEEADTAATSDRVTDQQTMSLKRDLLHIATRCTSRFEAGVLFSAKGNSIVALVVSGNGNEKALLAVVQGIAEAISREIQHSLPSQSVSIAIAEKAAGLLSVEKTYKQARRALDAAKALGRRGQIISARELGLSRILLQLEDKNELRAYIDETIGPLIRYDENHHGSLVKTVEAFLEHGCSLQAAAQTLFVHANTLHYRLQKVSQLTGLDLHNTEHRLNLQLALKIHQLARGWA